MGNGVRRVLAVVLALMIAGAGKTSAAAEAKKKNDHLIVPGQRIGLVALGMSAADLYRLMGEPKSQLNDSAGRFTYEWADLIVSADRSGNVVEVSATGPAYFLIKTVGPRASELALQAVRPAPVLSQALSPGTNKYCYSDGLTVTTVGGNISNISVDAPGCPGSGHYSCFHYEAGIAVVDACKRD